MNFIISIIFLFNLFDNVEYQNIFKEERDEHEVTNDFRIVQIDSVLYQYRKKILYDCIVLFYNYQDTTDFFAIKFDDSLSVFSNCNSHIGGLVARNDTIFVAYVDKLLLYKYHKNAICPLIDQINLAELFPKNNHYYTQNLFIENDEIIGLSESFSKTSTKLDSNKKFIRIDYDYQDLFVWRYNFKDKTRNILKFFDYP